MNQGLEHAITAVDAYQADYRSVTVPVRTVAFEPGRVQLPDESARLTPEGTASLARHVGAERHERTQSRRGHRNGYKGRSLKTRVGELALHVPQARGVEPYSPMLFAKWQRSERALLVACAEMYFMGVSTRKVKRVLEKMGGFELSASTVSCVAQELDEKLTQFRQRRLDAHTWPYLMVDATYVKVRKRGRVRNQAVRGGGRGRCSMFAVALGWANGNDRELRFSYAVFGANGGIRGLLYGCRSDQPIYWKHE